MTHFISVPIKNSIRIALGVGALLLIPLALTLLNSNASIYGGSGGGFDWMPGDFLVMGILLFITGLGISFALRNLADPVHRTIAVAAIVGVLLIVWVELAVGAVSQLVQFLFA